MKEMAATESEKDIGTNIEERLNSLLSHIQTESGILDRLVYKNKNQHRRCPYFQALLKVRRDLKLLQSTGLGDILNALFPIIEGKQPASKAFQTKRRKKNNHGGKYNYQERLLGVARLLSQMAEPILKASIQISFLLAKSFFTGFSLTILALLARLRVLVQQMLPDVVLVFNKVSSLPQKKHLVQLTQGGIEAFREYYPSREEVLALECVWKKDKFVLLERTNNIKVVNRNEEHESLHLETSMETSIKYEHLPFFAEVQTADLGHSLEDTTNHSMSNENFPIDIQQTISTSENRSA